MPDESHTSATVRCVKRWQEPILWPSPQRNGSRHEWHCHERNIFDRKRKGTRGVTGPGRLVRCERKYRMRLGDDEASAYVRRHTAGVSARCERECLRRMFDRPWV